ncbi:MAG: hypothetical protein ACLQM8_16550, partial [Limisphaerales bacterium]
FAAALAVGFVVLNCFTGNALLIQLQQAWGAHFASARSLEYGSPEQHTFDWTVLLKNWDMTVPALLGSVLLLRSAWPPKTGLLPLAWLVLTLVVFGTHKPWWSYYYVHNALPLCWCAGVGIAQAFHIARAKRSYVLAVLLGLYGLCAIGWMGGAALPGGDRHTPGPKALHLPGAQGNPALQAVHHVPVHGPANLLIS